MHSHSSFDGFSQFTCISCVFVCFSFATPNISSIYVIAPTYADGAAAGPTNKTSRRRDDKMDFRRPYASCIDRANRNKEHDEKERAKNAEAQSVRFTFDDVNIDGLHYSILIRRAGEAKSAFISTTEKTKLDFSEDMVFSLWPRIPCAESVLCQTRNRVCSIYQCNYGRCTFAVWRRSFGNLQTKTEHNKNCKHTKIGDFSSALESARNEVGDGEKLENQSVAANVHFGIASVPAI